MSRSNGLYLRGQNLTERHICALVRGDDDSCSQLGPLIIRSLAEGDRSVHFVADSAPHLGRLAALGVDVTGDLESGQLDVNDWKDSYLRGSAFSAPDFLEFLRRVLDDGLRMGFGRTVVIATLDWCADEAACGDELVRFEASVNGLLSSRSDVVICVYGLDHHSASLITSVRDVHPLTLIDGVARPNRPLSLPSARERIIAAAHDHFHNRGIRATGVDTLIQAAGVAKATFYRYFPSKDDLVVAWLRDSRPRWFYRVRAACEASGRPPELQLLLLYEETARWLESEGFRGCSFQNAAVEITDSSHPAWPVIREYLDEIETYLRTLIEATGSGRAQQGARELAVLLSGALALGVAKRSTAPVVTARAAAAALLGLDASDRPVKRS